MKCCSIDKGGVVESFAVVPAKQHYRDMLKSFLDYEPRGK